MCGSRRVPASRVQLTGTFRNKQEETLAAQVAAEARAAELEQRSKSKETLKNEQALKAEIDRLRSDL